MHPVILQYLPKASPYEGGRPSRELNSTENIMNIMKSRYVEDLLSSAIPAVVCMLTAVFLASPAAANSGYGKSLGANNQAVRAQINLLEKATTAFYSYDVAQASGWSAVISDCVESPTGGMGYHVANPGELDAKPFTLSLLRPEVLLYAPMADGSMEFLGVEYIVPYTLANASTPPSILGQQLQYNPHLNIWALHVWTARQNPDGLFAPFNPTVSCLAD